VVLRKGKIVSAHNVAHSRVLAAPHEQPAVAGRGRLVLLPRLLLGLQAVWRPRSGLGCLQHLVAAKMAPPWHRLLLLRLR